MTDQYVGLQPDSSGKKIDTSELTVGANTVERQRIVVADPSVATGLAAVTAKGSQGAFALSVQELKNSGRTPVTLFLDEITTTTGGLTTSEALVTCTLWRNLASSSGTSFSVTSGKTFRITSIEVSCRSVGATASNSKVRLRANSGTLAITSSVVVGLVAGATNVTNSTGITTISIEDGYELPSGTNYGISHIDSATNTLGLSVVVTGFEY